MSVSLSNAVEALCNKACNIIGGPLLLVERTVEKSNYTMKSVECIHVS